MASTGAVNGTTIGLYVDGILIACATSHSLELGMDTRETTCKDSKGWKEVAEGTRNWSISGDFNFVADATYGFSDLFDLYSKRTKVKLKFATEETGDKFYQGDAYLTSLSETAGMEDTITFSASFEGSGEISELTLT
jgi:TP901-1 family phage major tail protein